LLCNDFLHIPVVFVKRAVNVEAHGMVTLAKLVGSETAKPGMG
jgi:hypothetical protein